MTKFKFILFSIFIFNANASFALLHPPVGSVHSSDLTASFMLFESLEEQKHAFGLDYKDDEIHIKGGFPGDSVWMYYKLTQSTPNDGFLIIKTIRKYKYPVSEKAKEKVNIIYNDGFYKKVGIIRKEWKQQINGKNMEKKFTFDQFKGYVKHKKIGEGIEGFLGFYWEKSEDANINRNDLRKYFAFNDYSEARYRLYSCRIYHHLPFMGTRYIDTKIPMANQNNNLDWVYIEVVEMRGGGFKKIKRYWLKEI